MVLLLDMQTSQNYIIDFPKAHSNKQALIMNFFTSYPECKDLFVSCGSKFGKTQAASTSISNGLINSRNAYWRWVAPIYEQARIGFDYCKKMLPIGDGFEAKDSRLAILCPELDSQIRYYHAHKADSLEGFATAGGVFDEAAKISKEAYDADNTTRSRTRSKRIYVSTPIGKNHFYNSCMEAKEEMILAKRQLRVPRMMFITAATFDNPYIPKESIEDMRRRLPDRLFRQYIMADFIDDADVFGNYRQCFEGQPIVFDSDDSHWFADAAKNSTVVVGADWARTRDYTVFIAIDVEHKRVVGFRRFHKRSYIEAVRELVRFCKLFKETQTVWHDKTGVGVALDDQLAYTDLSYKGVTFSNQSKSSMINSLITTFEHRALFMPYLSVLDKELGAYEIKVNDIGTMTYNAPSGMHDDTVMALVLAHAALMQYSDLRYEVRFLEDLRGDAELSKLTPLEQYYSDID